MAVPKRKAIMSSVAQKSFVIRNYKLERARDFLAELFKCELERRFGNGPDWSAPEHEAKKERICEEYRSALGITCDTVPGQNQELIGYASFAAARILDFVLSNSIMTAAFCQCISRVEIHCEERRRAVAISGRTLRIHKARVRWENYSDAGRAIIYPLASALYNTMPTILQEDVESPTKFAEDFRSLVLDQRALLSVRYTVGDESIEPTRKILDRLEDGAFIR